MTPAVCGDRAGTHSIGKIAITAYDELLRQLRDAAVCDCSKDIIIGLGTRSAARALWCPPNPIYISWVRCSIAEREIDALVNASGD